jgi:hypothetical protein
MNGPPTPINSVPLDAKPNSLPSILPLRFLSDSMRATKEGLSILKLHAYHLPVNQLLSTQPSPSGETVTVLLSEVQLLKMLKELFSQLIAISPSFWTKLICAAEKSFAGSAKSSRTVSAESVQLKMEL